MTIPTRGSAAVASTGITATTNSAHSAVWPHKFDAVVVGVGFAGLYLLHKLRGLGLRTLVLEAGADVGGTWFWNRYPGARCDIPTTDYTYSFDPALEDAWTWSEKYATQPEILRYARFVAERYDLRRDIRFNTRLEAAAWDDAAACWHLRTSTDAPLRCRYLVMASGCLSVPKAPDIPGAQCFQGPTYFTSRWPAEGVDFTGQRVAVIGTGSSGVQSIPLIAQQAAQLTVFQRTPTFSIPALNGPVRPERRAALDADRAAYRAAARQSRAGVTLPHTPPLARFTPPAEQRALFEQTWALGELVPMQNLFADQALFADANAVVADLVRAKIRAQVNDPAIADLLCPTSYPFGTKRPCLDSGYFATYNQSHVRLVDLRRQPITRITEQGIDTADESLPFDAIVYATGFDAMTGALLAVDITGRDGRSLRQKWADGPATYLGLMTHGFPNLFTITGPGSPSVMTNMMPAIEQHVDWVADCLVRLRDAGHTRIEPTATAEAGWVAHVNDCADITLFPQADSWYVGANVPGKPRVFLPYLGGLDAYRQACDEVVARGDLGFERSGPAGRHCHDGVVRPLQPDVGLVLQALAGLDLPPFESLPPAQARALLAQMNAARPPGPAVGAVEDGTMDILAPDSGSPHTLAWRLYRPATPGPHPLVVYFHGGGWVLGDTTSDDPLCRDLCVRSGCLVLSVDYRHAPEARFPAAADDALAAVRWAAANAQRLGGIPGALALAGWSAGANLAAVTCQALRDAGDLRIAGQLLLTPATDGDFSRPSYAGNGEGLVLTLALMRWFRDQYTGPDASAELLANPRLAPLRAASFAGLPPACIVTCEFDPLRDEGAAYARALADAGVPVQHIDARGHIHTSLTMVDVVLSGAPHRAAMAAALRGFFSPALTA